MADQATEVWLYMLTCAEFKRRSYKRTEQGIYDLFSTWYSTKKDKGLARQVLDSFVLPDNSYKNLTNLLQQASDDYTLILNRVAGNTGSSSTKTTKPAPAKKPASKPSVLSKLTKATKGTPASK